MPEWMPIITAIVAVIISIFAARREWRFGRPDALSKYEKLVDELVTSNAELIKRVDCLEAELEDYRIGVVILITQMEAVGIQPKWKPGDEPSADISRPRSRPRKAQT